MDLLKVERLKLRIHAWEFTVFNSLAIDGKAFVDGNHDDGRKSDSLFLWSMMGNAKLLGRDGIQSSRVLLSVLPRASGVESWVTRFELNTDLVHVLGS